MTGRTPDHARGAERATMSVVALALALVVGPDIGTAATVSTARRDERLSAVARPATPPSARPRFGPSAAGPAPMGCGRRHLHPAPGVLPQRRRELPEL